MSSYSNRASGVVSHKTLKTFIDIYIYIFKNLILREVLWKE